jgi:hypothetical protein
MAHVALKVQVQIERHMLTRKLVSENNRKYHVNKA